MLGRCVWCGALDQGYGLCSAPGSVEVCSHGVPLPALDRLWVLGRGALLTGADPAALQARRVPRHSLTPFSLLLLQASNGQWYQMNDDLVRSSNIKVVLNQQAYVLFYLR